MTTMRRPAAKHDDKEQRDAIHDDHDPPRPGTGELGPATPEDVAAMGKYNEQLEEAGVLLALDRLQETAKGARVGFAGGKPRVTDGPFPEAKEVIGGYWMIEAPSRSRRWRGPHAAGGRRRHHRGPPGIRDDGCFARGAGSGSPVELLGWPVPTLAGQPV